MTTRARAGLRIPYELNTTLALTAQKMGVSKNALILQILQDWVKKQKKLSGGEKPWNGSQVR